MVKLLIVFICLSCLSCATQKEVEPPKGLSAISQGDDMWCEFRWSGEWKCWNYNPWMSSDMSKRIQ